MIASTINEQIAKALKAKDEVRLSTLRMLSSALNYEKIAKQHELSEDEELAVVRREAKKRQDAIEIYSKHKNQKAEELKKKEEEELRILREFLPPQMSEEELEKLVDEVIKEIGTEEVKDMGKVIGEVVRRAEGRADGKMIAEEVRERLRFVNP